MQASKVVVAFKENTVNKFVNAISIVDYVALAVRWKDKIQLSDRQLLRIERLERGDPIDPLAEETQMKARCLELLNDKLESKLQELKQCFHKLVKALEALSTDQFFRSIDRLKSLMKRLAATRCHLVCGRLLEWYVERVNEAGGVLTTQQSVDLVGHMINGYCCLVQLFAEYLMYLEFEIFQLLGVEEGLHQV